MFSSDINIMLKRRKKMRVKVPIKKMIMGVVLLLGFSAISCEREDFSGLSSLNDLEIPVFPDGNPEFTGPGDIDLDIKDFWGVRSLNSVAFGHDLYVAVGSDILYSIDGLKWVKNDYKPNGVLREIIWTGKQFVAVGSSGNILVSPRGYKWIRTYPYSNVEFSGIAFIDNLIVVAGTRQGKGVAITSVDGTLWIEQQVDGPEHRWKISRVIHTGSEFVALATSVSFDYDFLLVSPDARKWEVVKINHRLQHLIWNGSHLAATGIANGEYCFLSSNDVSNWRVTAKFHVKPYTFAWSGSLYIMTLGGEILRSENERDWTAVKNRIPEGGWDSHWCGGRFFIINNSGYFGLNYLLTSQDGSDWSYAYPI
jgi:hypothetical protein